MPDPKRDTKRTLPLTLDVEPDGTAHALWHEHRVRFLLDDGRTFDVLTTRDDSDLREAVLRHTGATRIEGSARP